MTRKLVVIAMADTWSATTEFGMKLRLLRLRNFIDRVLDHKIAADRDERDKENLDRAGEAPAVFLLENQRHADQRHRQHAMDRSHHLHTGFVAESILE